MARCGILALSLAGALLLPAVQAHAQFGAADSLGFNRGNWPTQLVRRPTVLGAGMTELRGEAYIDLSSGRVGEPIGIRPAVYYGVSNKLTVGISSPQYGVCLGGEDAGCPRFFNDAGVDATYRVRGDTILDLSARGGLFINRFSDPTLIELRIGASGKYRSGNLAVFFDPSIGIPVTERDFANESLSLPFDFAFQASPNLAVTAHTGIVGPLDGFGDSFVVPLGAGAFFSTGPQLDVGGRFIFTNLAGNNSSADYRTLELLANFRL